MGLGEKMYLVFQKMTEVNTYLPCLLDIRKGNDFKSMKLSLCWQRWRGFLFYNYFLMKLAWEYMSKDR